MASPARFGARIAPLAACLAFCTLALAAPPPVVTVPTARMNPGAVRNPAADPAPGAVMYASLTLTVPNQPALDAFTASLHDPHSPNYRQWITPAQFGARFGHSDADIQAIRAYAAANGFTVEHAWDNHLFVTLKGTVAQFEAAMNIRLLGWNRPSAVADGQHPTCVAADRDPSFPSAIGSLLRGVYGLGDAIRMAPQYQRALNASPTKGGTPPGPPPAAIATAAGAGDHTGFGAGRLHSHSAPWPGPATPWQISHVYQNDLIRAWGYMGDNMTVAVFSPTNFNASDTAGFASTYGITGWTLVEKLVDGGATDSGGDVEACLDSENIIGQANHVNVVMYEAPNSNLLVDLWMAMVNDNVPVISVSWGLWEDYYHTQIAGGDGYVATENTALQQADAQGISLFCASGDYGIYDPYTSYTVSGLWPATCPFVTACGGTSLPQQDGSFGWAGETGWGGSGGGNSIYFARPPWQNGPGVSNGSSNGFRQLPDASSLADPGQPGFSVYYAGGLIQVGGTSAAAPLWSGNVILIDQFLFDFSFTQRRIGDLAPDLYRIGTTMNAATDVFTFHDQVSGNNGLPCTANWDYVTGWGSPNFFKLLCNEAFWSNLHPFAPAVAPPGGAAWDTPLIVHDNSATSGEPMFYENQGSYYVGVGAINDGPADSPPNVMAVTYYGNPIAMLTMGPYPSASGPFISGPSAYLATLNGGGYYTLNGTGYYLFGMKADWYNSVGESNEFDNTFQKYVAASSNSTDQPALASIQVSPNSVVGGNSVTGTVTLAANAVAPGAMVAVVAGDPTVIGVPMLVTVPAGSNSATFTVNTYGVGSTVTETIYAHCAGATQSCTLSVSKAIINNLTISASPVPGGTNPLVSVNLTGMAPPAGLTVTLNTTVPSAATVPASIFIPANTTSGGFYPTTYPQNTDTFTTVQGTAYGSTRSVGLIVQYPRISTVTWTANPVAGGSPTIATVTLTGPTTPAGLSVSLASSNFPIAQVPITFAFSGGATTASFLVTTHDPAVNTNVTVTLTTHGVNYPQTLTVNH